MHKLKQDIQSSINAKKSLLNIEKKINLAILNIFSRVKNGGKIMLCGNGGSAADAQHLAAEFLIRLKPGVNRSPIPAITLAQDTSTITACGNDFNFNIQFARCLEALGKKEDILIVISTSGNSRNIINVLKNVLNIFENIIIKLPLRLIITLPITFIGFVLAYYSIWGASSCF